MSAILVVQGATVCCSAGTGTIRMKLPGTWGAQTGYGAQMLDVHTAPDCFEGVFSKCSIQENCTLDLCERWQNAQSVSFGTANMAPMRAYSRVKGALDQSLQEFLDKVSANLSDGRKHISYLQDHSFQDRMDEEQELTGQDATGQFLQDSRRQLAEQEELVERCLAMTDWERSHPAYLTISAQLQEARAQLEQLASSTASWVVVGRPITALSEVPCWVGGLLTFADSGQQE